MMVPLNFQCERYDKPYNYPEKGCSVPIRPTNTTIVLREGIHFLEETLQFRKPDSGFTMTSYPGEQAWISGGI
jgi:hypothetical protein